MHLHIELFERMTYQNIVCFNWIPLIFVSFYFFVPFLLCVRFDTLKWDLCHCWRSIDRPELISITYGRIHSEIIAYDCHCKHLMLCANNFPPFVRLQNANPLWGRWRRLNRSATTFFYIGFFYSGVKFCWHPNICPINCILSLCHLLIETMKLYEISIQSINRITKATTKHQMDNNTAELNNFLSSCTKCASPNG